MILTSRPGSSGVLKTAILLVVAAALAAGIQATAPKHDKTKEPAMAENPTQVLQESKDPKELYAAAVTLLNSPQPADHEALSKALSRESLLGRLDSPQDYERSPRFLHISRLIKAMRASEVPSVRQILVDLSSQEEFLANETRVEMLIWASPVLRPAPPAIVKFWDDYCRGGDSTNALVAAALADNGSQPAIELLEKKLTAAGFEDDEKVWWMRTAVLTHRHDALLLQACRRLLEGGLAEALRPALVEVLFDYRPVEWHGPDDGWPPPKLETLDRQSRALLIDIGQHVLGHLKLDEALKKTVEAKVKALSKGRG